MHELDCPCHAGKIRQPSAIRGVNLADLNSTSCYFMTEMADDKKHRYLHLVGVDVLTQCIIEVKVAELTDREGTSYWITSYREMV